MITIGNPLVFDSVKVTAGLLAGRQRKIAKTWLNHFIFDDMISENQTFSSIPDFVLFSQASKLKTRNRTYSIQNHNIHTNMLVWNKDSQFYNRVNWGSLYFNAWCRKTGLNSYLESDWSIQVSCFDRLLEVFSLLFFYKTSTLITRFVSSAISKIYKLSTNKLQELQGKLGFIIF